MSNFRLLNNIVLTNEPTSAAVKRHRLFNQQFEEDEKPTKEKPIHLRKIINVKPREISDDSDQIEQSSSNWKRWIPFLFKSDAKKEEITPYNLHFRMNDIFLIHDELCEISELVNSAFAVQIVVLVTGTFAITLYGFFFDTKVIAWNPSLSNPLIKLATSYVLWGVATCSGIYLILNICTSTKEESFESAMIIHKILQNKPAFMIADDTYYNKMKSFTLQILHRKNVFHFNGLGLFFLDYTFIFSAVSAATSYLIVLLQFDMDSEFKKFYEISQN